MSSLPAGTTVGRYQIVRTLGIGGMGEVYDARDESLERSVALKVLPPSLVADEDRVRRFVQEAKSASALSHPHIVAIYEIGEARVAVTADDGTTEERAIHFIAMEQVDGPTLGQKIHQERADLKELLSWLSQAASGLAKAHAANIVHRDLKPDNVMITADGFAKVLDFGLAKLVQPADDQTQAATALAAGATADGVVLGTAGYMSPEQVRGVALDHRSDIFSFGCLLYEAATRARPFRGETSVDTMHQVLREEPVDVHEINPEVPGALRRLIRRCLNKDPDQRVQSMKDLALELGDLVDEYEDLATGVGQALSGPEAAVDPGGRRTPWIVIATVALAAVGILGWLGLRDVAGPGAAATSEVSPPLRASFAQLTTDVGVETEADISPNGNFIVYVGGDRGREDLFLLRVGGRNPINLTAESGSADIQPAFSPDGQSIAFRSDRDGGGIFVMGATGESVRRVADLGYNPDWSPDGTRLVVAEEDTGTPYSRSIVSRLFVVDLGTEEVSVLFEGDAAHPRWSPDGRWIAYWGLIEPESGQRDIGVIPADGGKALRITNQDSIDWNPIWSAASDALYFVSDRGGSTSVWRVRIDPQTAEPLDSPVPLTTPARWSGFLALSADGTKLLFSAVDDRRNIVRLDLDPGAGAIVGGPYPVTSGTSSFVQPSVSPDGDWIAFRSGLPQEDLYLIRPDGTDLRRLTDDRFKDRGPKWHPDGSRILFYSDRSGRYEIWTIRPDGSGLQQLTEQSERSVWFPFFSPDETVLFGINEFGTVRFDLGSDLPARGGTPLPSPDSDHYFQAIAVTPDGDRLVGTRVNRKTGAGADGIVQLDLGDESYTVLFEAPLGGRFPVLLRGGRRVLFVHEGRFKTVDIETGADTILALPTADFWRGGVPADLDHSDFDTGVLAVGPDDRSIYLVQRRVESDIWMAELEDPG